MHYIIMMFLKIITSIVVIVEILIFCVSFGVNNIDCNLLS